MTRRSSEVPPYRVNLSPVPKLARSAALLRSGVLSILVAVVIFGLLTVQMVSGNDPALGNDRKGGGTSASAAEPTDYRIAPSTTVIEPEESPVPVAPAAQPVPVPQPVQTSTS